MLKTIKELVTEAKLSSDCLTIAEAGQFMRQPDCLRIDVRESEEHQQGAIPGFINMPRGVLEMRIPSLSTRASQPILLHCATGGRAALAAVSLKGMGYKTIKLIDASFENICDELNHE